MVKEDGGYFFKFDEDYELQTSYCLRNRKYTIKFVDRSGIIFNFPILKFRNLEYDEYQEMLQILEEINVASTPEINEIKDLAHDQNQTKIIYRYMYMGGLSAFALLFGILLFVYNLHDYEQKIIEICKILSAIGFIGNLLMMFVVDLWVDPSDIEKMRKFYISQYIEAIFVILVFSIVFAFFIRPN